MAAQENKWEDTLALTEKVLRMNPYDFPTAYYFNAVANLQLHKLDAAEKSAREAVKIDKLHRMPKAEYVLGIVLAQKEDFNEAAEHLRSYLKMVPEGKESILVKQQLAEVEKFAQKR
jgi:tetratricopeptide (TPR) repeat protein